MEARRIKRLLVLELGRLVGIVSRADLLRALEQLLPRESVAAVSNAQICRRVPAEIDK
jgi:CBS domain-containing protein